MAPRGRSKKRGNTRMDAAVEAMSEFGFSASLVRQAVKHLLKVYGGDEYWVFIERESYKVLLDFILDNNNKDCDGDGGTKAIMDAEASTVAAIEGVNVSNTELMAISYSSEPLDNNKDIDAVTTGLIEAVPVNIAASHIDFGAGFKHDETREMDINDHGVNEEEEEEETGEQGGLKHGQLNQIDSDDDVVYLNPEPLPTALQKILKPGLASSSKGTA